MTKWQEVEAQFLRETDMTLWQKNRRNMKEFYAEELEKALRGETIERSARVALTNCGLLKKREKGGSGR